VRGRSRRCGEELLDGVGKFTHRSPAVELHGRRQLEQRFDLA
jgi:hypothetical protein